MPIINTPPRSTIQTRRMKNQALTRLMETDGNLPTQTKSLPPMLQEDGVVVKTDPAEQHQRPFTTASNKSSTSSAFMARKLQLEMEAALAKARIEKDLIDKRLELEIAALEVQSNRSEKSYRTGSSGKQKVEKWLERSYRETRSDRELEAIHGPPQASGQAPAHIQSTSAQPELLAHPGNQPHAGDGAGGPPALPTPLPHPTDQPHVDGRGTAAPPAPSAPTQAARIPTDIEKLADALQSAICASTSKVQSPELLSRLTISRDLPLYFGDPMEWLQFKDAYVETTTRCKFSDSENMDRLRKCLRGEAKEAVVSMLCGKTDPAIIMETLELRFGHPDVIINKIVTQIKKIQPLSQAYHNEIVNFATKIKNFAVTARSIDQADYLRSPELMNTVLAKFPSSLINRWTDYAFDHLSNNERSKFEHLSDFLLREATKTASAGVSHIYSQAEKSRKQYEDRRPPQYPVLLTSDSEKCNFCHTSHHQLPDCPRFKRAMRRDRWRFVRFNKLCYKCLVSQHDKQTCPAVACNVDNCGQDHHKLLHWIPKKDNSFKDDCANVTVSEINSQPSVNSVPEVDASLKNSAIADISDYVNNTNFRDNKVLLKVVCVTVHGPKGNKRAFALLDDAATVSLLSADLANSIGLHGYSETLQVRGAWNNTELRCTSEIVNLTITNDSGDSCNLRARKMNDLNLPVQKLSSVKFDSYEHLKDYKKFVLHDDVKPELLIGQDHYHLLVPLVTVPGSYNKPYVTRTPLGWCLHGNVRSAPVGRRVWYENDAAVLSAPGQPRAYPAPAQPAPPAPPGTTSPSRYELLPRKTMDLHTNNLDSKIQNNCLCAETIALVQDTGDLEPREDNEELRNLARLVRYSFAFEAIGVTTKPRQCKDDLRAMAILDNTAKLVDGQWEVGLPWKSDAPMPKSYPNAFNRLISLERKFKKDESYAARYRERINHLFTNGYAREIRTEEPAVRVWNLPHFGIDNLNKKKLRVVFDSAATSSGQSLNDYLLQGPDLLQSLLGIMFRFREGAIAWAGDIKDMYLRINIRKEDQDALRFLWREDNADSVKTYAMTSLIFGANCSPFVAQYIKNKNAQRFEREMPEAVNAIVKSHYMDDYLDSHDDEQKAKAIVHDVLKIHKSGGFEMRNLMCNRPQVLHHLPKEALNPNTIRFNVGNEDCNERTLGLLWNPVTDTLGFDVTFKRIPVEILSFKQVPTKRDVLRIIMSIFDVYGLLAPFTIKGRILIQDTWKSNINWDDKLPEKLNAVFQEWIAQLQTIKDLKIPRWYFSSPVQTHSVQLHVFCDASLSAYSCVAYWRVVNDDNSVQVAFIASKSRVAPVKPAVSVPRLELQAAVLGCRLAAIIEKEHRIKPSARFFWTDSTTVLYWIKNENRNYKVFIANRLGEIDSSSNITEWHHVSTSMNIADAATKTNSYKLEADSEWIRGPDFLYSHPEEWPAASEKEKVADESILERVLTIDDTYHTNLPVPDPDRFSSWRRLLGATAAVIKFVDKCRKIPEKSPYETMKQAERLIIRQAQWESFKNELTAIKKGQIIERTSKLTKLSPFLDEYNILRAGGRINAAPEISPETKQPVILDGRHQVSRLIARHYHVQAAHGNQETVVNELKQKYWLIKLRPTVKHVTSKCMFCRIRRTKPQMPRMGDLPVARVTHHQRAFTHCGVDLFGPQEVTVGRRREKRYGVLFTCLTVRAVHIEIVSSLTSDSLIMALRRMAARRGWPYYIYSDNGTNLRGAEVELKRAVQGISQEALRKAGAKRDVNWVFIPPGSPHWGGAWERLIGAAKRVLKVILKERAPRDETLATVMTEVESIMNSRPLTHVTVEPGSSEAITPYHFLILSSSSLPVPGEFNDSEFFLRKQWRISQRLADMFWMRWVKEVLPDMIPRSKWNQEQRPLRVGDLVLVVDPDGPRNVWPRGIIQEGFPGKDGRVRVVTIKTKSGTLKRSAARVALIPMEDLVPLKQH